MNQEKSINLEDRWLKGAVLGSLWASFEIIVGSLLHNLRIPFAGTFLTFFAVVLLISFSKIWPQKGVIFRAGIICALMKSISPSAVIIGPMVGIVSEAIIVELVLMVTGRNLGGYILSGALAVLSALLHKLGNLLIIYGFDLINVYVNMLDYARHQLTIIRLSPEQLLYLLISIYLFIGALGGITGYFIGQKASRKNQVVKKFRISVNPDTEEEINQKYSLLLLFLHVLFLILCLIFFEKSIQLHIKTGVTMIYLIFNFYYYKNISGRLMKPLFWVQLFIVLIFAGLFLETSHPDKFSFQEAILNGYNMFLRAILVVSAFSAISTELANPEIRRFLVRNGFRKLYLALQLSFSALPVMLENNSNLRSFFRNPVNSLSSLVADAESWLQSFKQINKN